MKPLQALRISTREVQEHTNGYFLPSAVMGSLKNFPIQGKLLVESEDTIDNKTSVGYSLVDSFIIHGDEEQVIIASTQADLLGSLFGGYKGGTSKEAHEMICNRLKVPDISYVIFPEPILRGLELVRKEMMGLLMKIEGLKEYFDRVTVLQIENERRKVHLVQGQGESTFDTEIIDLEQDYYIPHRQRVKVILTEDFEKKSFLPDYHQGLMIGVEDEREIKPFLHGIEVVQVDSATALSFATQLGLPLQTTFLRLLRVNIEKGFYVRSEYEQDVQEDREKKKDDLDRGLSELMKDL